MSDALTEARAIAGRLREDIREEANGYRRQSLKMAADALDTLAAKDAEMEGWKRTATEYASELHSLRSRLAEARKALEPFAREADGWDADQNDGFVFHDTERLDGEHRLNVGHLRAARRALTGGQEGG
ncbi:MAG: hypothetical protein WCY29_05940 [Novosphingobium sp.]